MPTLIQSMFVNRYNTYNYMKFRINSRCPKKLTLEKYPNNLSECYMADKPEADKPEADKPEADKPEADKPEAGKPEADKPEADKPDAGKPDAGKPDADKPDADKPDSNKPISNNSKLVSEKAPSPYLVVFGNSLSDIGNLENITFAIPWWNRRFSNGPVWNEYLAYYNDYTLINFAVGGATSNNTSVKIFTNVTVEVPSILDQIGLYTKTFGGKINPNKMLNDIAVIEIGANDLLDGLELEASLKIDVEEFTDSIVNNIITAIKLVKKLGFKKILATTVSDVAKTPAVFDFPPEAQKNINKYVSAVNSKILDLIPKEFGENSESNFVKIIQLHKLIDLVTGPLSKDLGLTVVNKDCHLVKNNKLISSCDNPDNHAFMDSVHPSTKIHALTGSIFAQTINNTAFEINEETVRPLIQRYNINKADSKKNFLYRSGSGGKKDDLNIHSYNLKGALASANIIISKKKRCNKKKH
ncbi:hypothetical protein BB561_003637 [Smittium simulii]|uniref:Uncharacterized protein n=1 Tax=Smittium simulii TaxID=133385 RepID=A0A2T9YK80_9FUNG|nr:hypothetical protein BB561_003637 [Smittium simulii]